MKRLTLLFVALACMLSFSSCSNDDDAIVKDGKLNFDGRKIPYEPVDVSTLPQWLQDHVGKSLNFLYEGTWEGKHAYIRDGMHSSHYTTCVIGYMDYEDGTPIYYEIEDFEANGGWDMWKCIYIDPYWFEK